RNDNGRNDRYFSVCDNGARPARLACANRELRDADRRLNVVYSQMIADAQRSDRAEQRFGYPSWYSREVALRNAERAWMAMRDSDCRFVTQPDVGRRRALDLSMTLCQADRTNARIDQLEAMRDDLRESYS